MISAPRRWAAAAMLVTVGWLGTPQAVPVYDGVGAPDEPYRYVSGPSGAKATAAATTGSASSPVVRGTNSSGMSVQTAEQGPQASLFIPPLALASPGKTVTVALTPEAVADQPPGATVDGNVYALTVTDPAGPVTRTAQAAIATLYLRSTTVKQPGPVMEYRPGPAKPWTELKTSRGGQDIYVSAYEGPGQYALAFVNGAEAGGGSSPLLLVLVAGGLLVLVVVVVVRLRAHHE